MTASHRIALAAIALATVAIAAPARAETRRIAVLVGHNAGSDGQPPLRWAEDDAGKLADVFVQLGDVRPADLFLVQGKGATRVKDALQAATAAVRAARRAPDDRVIVYFYYSGHSDGTAIELGGDRLSFADLKALLAGTGADVRVVIVDACKSGSLVAKGGRPGPAFSIDLVDDLNARGEAMLTSSAADEQSLESSEVRGSFFTHHLVSGLRGAADASGDGRVTLSEAYDYAFGKTVTASAATGALPQHPSYDYRLSGRGELVLTDVGVRSAALELPAGFDRALVVAVQRDQIIAEITSDAARRVAVAPGSYAVRLWRKGTVVAGRIAAADGAVAQVRWDDLAPIDIAPAPRKGDSVAQKDEGELPSSAQEVYDANMLWFGGETVLLHGTTGAAATVVPRYAVYLGKYRKELEFDDFFTRVQRPDLVDKIRTRRTIAKSMFYGGIAATVVGFGFSLTHMDTFGTTSKLMFGLGFIGTTSAISSGFITPQVAPPDEMRRMTDEYNQQLRARLRATPAAPPGVTARLAPYVLPGGAGGVLSGTF